MIQPSLRTFQYKILNKILYLNDCLYKLGHVQSSLCSLCNSEVETVLHLFCNYSVTNQFWSFLSSWLQDCVSLPMLEPDLATLGWWKLENGRKMLASHICLVFNHFIFSDRKLKYTINIFAFKRHLIAIQKIKQKILFRRNVTEIIDFDIIFALWPRHSGLFWYPPPPPHLFYN